MIVTSMTKAWWLVLLIDRGELIYRSFTFQARRVGTVFEEETTPPRFVSLKQYKNCIRKSHFS